MNQSEASFQRRVLRDLKKVPNLWVYKAADRAKKGIPDLLICVNRIFVAVELKQEGKKPTALQQHTLEQIGKARGYAFSVVPSKWPTLLLMLTRLATGNTDGNI